MKYNLKKQLNHFAIHLKVAHYCKLTPLEKEKCLKWNGKARRRSSQALPFNFDYITNRRFILHLQQEESYYFSTQQEERRISPCRAMVLPKRHSQLNQQKATTLQIPVSTNGLFFYSSSFKLPLLYKRTILFFVLWPRLWFSIDCVS